ncbi:RAD55 family ATPase [Halalkalirubrum salinum]|uniref:RAD55 family ATPase n=1 Tax=Halalkalirubrum salinum TaxID=2563889 RepID=UPI0010FB8C91|nr:ATPase domain-containing protein [Halalkalirubrum salinum]
MSPEPPEQISTGVTVLDTMLDGGLPYRRGTLVSGGPGTGKSTLAMQFLQAGLDTGDRCLYISTEQTIEELTDSFASFEFDLAHENLMFASIHATPGETLEDGEQFVLQTLNDGERFGEGFNIPFTSQYIHEHLQRYQPCDRIVLDSASGLATITDGPDRYRRIALDLIRFFTDELEATALLTAENHGDQDTYGHTSVLQFTTHGVIELDRELVNNDPHRYLSIKKMRGVDHDRRRVEIEFTPEGLRGAPSRRSQPPELKNHAHEPVGIEGLDNLAGGGIVRGSGVLLEHDGRANLGAFFSQLLAFAIRNGYSIVLVPTIELRQTRVEALLASHDISLEELLETERLHVVDLIGAWDQTVDNVYGPQGTADELINVMGSIRRDSDKKQFCLINADAVIHALGAADARRFRYHETYWLTPDDMLIHVTNASVVDDQINAFYGDAAEQILKTWIKPDGLQYLSLPKSPCGFVGSTSLVEYISEPPYIRVQNPPQTPKNPYASE